MAHWLVVVPRERQVAERLYHHEALEFAAGGLTEGDDVVLAAGEPPVVFGLGRVQGRALGDEYDPDDPAAPEANAEGSGEVTGAVSVRYTHRLLDDPVPLNGIAPLGGFGTSTATVAGARVSAVGRPHPLSEADFAALTARIGSQHSVTAPKQSWLVGVELPIEATSPAEAVRWFWSYVKELGPSELPAFVSPAGDELAMQAFVLGGEASLDPEEEE